MNLLIAVFKTRLVLAIFFGLFGMLLPNTGFSRSTPVTVDNWPDTQLVQDVDLPANQPYQFDDSRYSEIDGNISLATGVSSDLVPEGKRLVIQHLSFSLSSTGIQADPYCYVDVVYRRPDDHLDWIVTHPLEPTKYLRAYDRVTYISSQPITLYVDPNMYVQVGCSVLTTENTSIKAALTGYYIDLD